jgi:hypothetical protein
MGSMMFLVSGSSAAGKTFALNALRERQPELVIHDFDEIGVPASADTAWRQRANEAWVRRAIDYQAEGTDILLAGQTPYGELLAAPSSTELEAISACLIDCDDATRTERLRARGPEWLASTAGDLQDFLNWADWMRHHVADPAWRQNVIRQGDAEKEMRWDRWVDWQVGDPRWRVRLIDTSHAPVERVADELSTWVDEERALLRSGGHPLGAAALRYLDLKC